MAVSTSAGTGEGAVRRWVAHSRRRPCSIASTAARQTRRHTGAEHAGTGGRRSHRADRWRLVPGTAASKARRTAIATGQSQKEWGRPCGEGTDVEQGQRHGWTREPGMASRAKRQKGSLRAFGQRRRHAARSEVLKAIKGRVTATREETPRAARTKLPWHSWRRVSQGAMSREVRVRTEGVAVRRQGVTQEARGHGWIRPRPAWNQEQRGKEKKKRKGEEGKHHQKHEAHAEEATQKQGMQACTTPAARPQTPVRNTYNSRQGPTKTRHHQQTAGRTTVSAAGKIDSTKPKALKANTSKLVGIPTTGHISTGWN